MIVPDLAPGVVEPLAETEVPLLEPLTELDQVKLAPRKPIADLSYSAVSWRMSWAVSSAAVEVNASRCSVSLRNSETRSSETLAVSG